MNKKFVQKWQNFWFKEIPPHNLALLRLCLGAFLLIYWLVYLPRVPALFSNQGLVVPHPLFLDASWLAPPSLALAYIIYLVALLSITLFILGYHMRLAGLTLAGLMIYYYLLSFHNFPSSYNRIILFVLVVLSCSGADKTYSLWSKLKLGSATAWQPISAWPARLIAVQLTATYAGVALQKLVLESWSSGAILRYSLMGRWATDYAFYLAQLNLSDAFYNWSVHLIMLGELLLPVGLWLKRWQWLFFALGALFHLLVTVFLGMWWFLVLIPCYVVFLEIENNNYKLKIKN